MHEAGRPPHGVAGEHPPRGEGAEGGTQRRHEGGRGAGVEGRGARGERGGPDHERGPAVRARGERLPGVPRAPRRDGRERGGSDRGLRRGEGEGGAVMRWRAVRGSRGSASSGGPATRSSPSTRLRTSNTACPI